MKFIQTNLKDGYVVEPVAVKDERGTFARIFCKRDFAEIGHVKEFVQVNHSVNLQKGTIRGLHFQRKPYAEIKLIQCLAGSVFDVMVDLRSGSSTFLKWFGTVLSKENKKMMYIPEGFAHGFQTLEDNSELLYHHTEYYTPSDEGGVFPFDKTIDIKWPAELSTCSDKDRNLPIINEKFIGL
jgi:dTDP-4-dehydrorhamnose 3,5-epimerase